MVNKCPFLNDEGVCTYSQQIGSTCPFPYYAVDRNEELNCFDLPQDTFEWLNEMLSLGEDKMTKVNKMVKENEKFVHPIYGEMKPIVLNTRESCIEDGILIDNDLTKKLVKEAGFNISIVFGHMLWGDYIVPSKEDEENEGQYVGARLWDVLTVFKFMAMPKMFEHVGGGQYRPKKRKVAFNVNFVVNGERKAVEIWAAITSDKDGNLAVNIFLPSED